jgi:REP element-mobilizing transposase RayT
MKRAYRRHLPHEVPEGFPIFVTWNLKGALPTAVMSRLRSERAQLEREACRLGETDRERLIRHSKVLFASADAYLDTCITGPLILRDPKVAETVQKAISGDASVRYQLWAWCVKANHVHVLLTPLVELSDVTKRLKGGTAYLINQLQNEIGRTLWQDESYDHWARDDDEMLRIIEYIENNPVKAGLCAKPADWPWSSARFRNRWHVGTPYVRQALAGQSASVRLQRTSDFSLTIRLQPKLLTLRR